MQHQIWNCVDVSLNLDTTKQSGDDRRTIGKWPKIIGLSAEYLRPGDLIGCQFRRLTEQLSGLRRSLLHCVGAWRDKVVCLV